MKKTETNYMILVVLFSISIVIANVVGARVITTGINLRGIEIAMSGGAITYAVTFLATDVIGELWGKDKARQVIKYGLIGQLFAAAAIMLTGLFPAVNQEVDGAFFTLLGMNWVFVLGSLTAYYVSQTWDVFIFHKIRQKYIEKHGSTKGGRWIWNNVSTMSSQVIDTVIYALVSFGFGMGFLFTQPGRMALVGIIIGQYFLKMFLALVDTPFFYLLTMDTQTGGDGEWSKKAKVVDLKS